MNRAGEHPLGAPAGRQRKGEGSPACFLHAAAASQTLCRHVQAPAAGRHRRPLPPSARFAQAPAAAHLLHLGAQRRHLVRESLGPLGQGGGRLHRRQQPLLLLGPVADLRSRSGVGESMRMRFRTCCRRLAGLRPAGAGRTRWRGGSANQPALVENWTTRRGPIAGPHPPLAPPLRSLPSSPREQAASPCP